MAREQTEKQESKFTPDPSVMKLKSIVVESGLRPCSICSGARDPKTGKCSYFPEHGGDPYKPTVRNED